MSESEGASKEKVAPTWSGVNPLAQRTICPTCEHLHRTKIATKCRCCHLDGIPEGNPREVEAP